MGAEPARPTSVTVISWVWIIMGGLMILGGLMGFFSFAMMQKMSGGQMFPPHLPPNAPAGFKPMLYVFSHFEYIAGLQVFIAIIAIISGIMFLKLRRWARTLLEILTWLAVIYLVGFGIYWVYMWVTMTGNIAQEQVPEGMGYFKYFGVVMGVIMDLIFGAPLVFMLIKLRSSVVKNAVK